MLGWSTINAVETIASCSSWINMRSIMSLKNFLILFSVGASSLALTWCCCYLTWTQVLHLRYPVPFIGYISAVVALVATAFSVWFLFPAHLRNSPPFRLRMKWLTFARFFLATTSVVLYLLLDLCFLVIPLSYQWILSPIMAGMYDILCGQVAIWQTYDL